MVTKGFSWPSMVRLQRGEHFAKGHGHGVGAQRFERVQEDVVLHDAHLDAAFKVFHLGDRAFAVGQVAKAVFPIGQIQARSFELLVEELTGGPSSTASASSLANRKGRSNAPSSLIMPTSGELDVHTISCVPARSACVAGRSPRPRRPRKR